ncbi:MAG: hypothetical protein QXP36_01975 [Conexivisphaerales archaeon]
MIYRRKLTPSEVDRHFIYIDEEHRSMFPPPGKKFDLIVRHQRITVKIDSHWRIWAASFWDDLPKLEVGDVVIFSKNLNGSLKLEAEK